MSEYQYFFLGVAAANRGCSELADKHYRSCIDRVVARVMAEHIASEIDACGGVDGLVEKHKPEQQ